MPIRDLECASCFAVESDFYQRRWDDPLPPCPSCGGPRHALISRFATPLTGPITTKYTDNKRENSHMEGFWAYRKRSSISGQPEEVFIDTFQKLREFNKAEGLAAPGEVPTNSTISADGRRLVSNGLPGQWQGGSGTDTLPACFWEMDKSLTSLKGKEPAPVASGPPCSVQVADAGLMEKFAAEAHCGPGEG